jgi:hypothetical protein
MAIWRMCIACWIPKARNTHSEYTILTVFTVQQWLQQRASMLRYAYIACRVYGFFLIVYSVCITVYAVRWLEALPRTHLFQGVMPNT